MKESKKKIYENKILFWFTVLGVPFGVTLAICLGFKLSIQLSIPISLFMSILSGLLADNITLRGKIKDKDEEIKNSKRRHR